MGELIGAKSTYGWYLRLGYTVQQSISANRSTVALSLQIYDGTGESYNLTANSCYYVLQGEKVYHPYRYTSKGWYSLGSKTITVDHADDGTASVDLSAEWHSGFSSQWTPASLGVSGTVALPTIKRLSALEIPDLVMGQAATLTVQQYGSSYKHDIELAWAGSTYQVATQTGNTSISWTPPLSLATDIPNAASGVGTLTITTYSGSAELGSREYNVPIAVPSSMAPTVAVVLSDAEGYADTYGAYVQSKSILQAATTASGQYGATIKSITLAVSGLTATGAEAEVGPLPEAGTVPYTVTVVDSRNLSTVYSDTIAVLPYNAPGISSVAAERCAEAGGDDPAGAYALVTFSGAISPLGNGNSAAYAVLYRAQGEDSWSQQAVTAAAGQFAVAATAVVPLAVDTVYELCVRATDDFGHTDSLIVVVPSAQVLFRAGPDMESLSLGQYLTEMGTFIVGGLFERATLPAETSFGGKLLLDLIHPVGSIYISTVSTSPGTLFGGTWEQLKDVFLLAAGDTYDAGDTGGAAEVTLTKTQLPTSTWQSVTGSGGVETSTSGAAGAGYGMYTNSTTWGEAHNNMPPYLVVYAWKRTE